MFAQLFRLIPDKKTTLALALSRVDDKRLRLTVTPIGEDEDERPFEPLELVGTPDELDDPKLDLTPVEEVVKSIAESVAEAAAATKETKTEGGVTKTTEKKGRKSTTKYEPAKLENAGGASPAPSAESDEDKKKREAAEAAAAEEEAKKKAEAEEKKRKDEEAARKKVEEKQKKLAAEAQELQAKLAKLQAEQAQFALPTAAVFTADAPNGKPAEPAEKV